MLRQHRHFRRNRRGRDFVVGDIHGNWRLLERALAEQAFDTGRDRLFSVGDLVDRGEENVRMLDLLDEPWFFSVFGNHELMLLDGGEDPGTRAMHRANGGEWFYRLPAAEQTRLQALLHQHGALAFTVETRWGSLGLIHACAPDDWETVQEVTLEARHWEELVWDRQTFRVFRQQPQMAERVRNVTLTVHGHVSCETTVRIGNRFWIDTLYRGGYLSVMPLESLRAWPEDRSSLSSHPATGGLA